MLRETVAVVAWDPYAVMDRMDEDAISKELEGLPVEDLVYRYVDQGKEKFALAKPGVDECCRLLAGQGHVIREQHPVWQLMGEGTEQDAFFIVSAARYAVSPTGVEAKLDEVTGTKRQPLYGVKRDGSKYRNEFWFEHGSQKAARNARLRLIPLDVKLAVIARARKEGKVRDVNLDESRKRKGDEDVASEKQLEFLAKLLKSHHVTDAERTKIVEWRDTKHHGKPPKGEASKLIDRLQKGVKLREEAEKGEGKTAAPGTTEPITPANGGPTEAEAEEAEVIREDINSLLASPTVPEKAKEMWGQVYKAGGAKLAHEDLLRIRKHLEDAEAEADELPY